jgi:F-box protein 9
MTTSSEVTVSRTRPSPLSSLLHALPIPADHTTFLPSDEALPTPIALLPPELLDPVLSHLDVASIERFALTCWRARYLTASATVWKRIAEGIYRGPAMVPDGWNARDLARRHAGEWRTTLVEEERIRMDGCYISVCHYM